jgi:hypothetical protein
MGRKSKEKRQPEGDERKLQIAPFHEMFHASHGILIYILVTG